MLVIICLVERLREEQVGDAQKFLRLSYSSKFPWKCHVVASFPQLVQRAAKCPKLSPASQWESPCEKLPEDKRCGETGSNLMTFLEPLDSMPKVHPPL